MNPGDESNLENSSQLSPASRTLLSILIIAYLAVVMLGPLSNPIASKNLTEPLSRKIAPIHQALFLGHGYRFFGPDPGPSHIVEFVITQENGETMEGQFPDREVHWPRLRYHRWFMLSETLFEESLGLIDEDQHKEIIAEFKAEIDAARMQNARPAMNELVRQRDSMETNHEFLHKRVNRLLECVANFLIDQHNGVSVEIFLRERLIASPTDVQSRLKLTDHRFISDRRSLGVFHKFGRELEELK